MKSTSWGETFGLVVATFAVFMLIMSLIYGAAKKAHSDPAQQKIEAEVLAHRAAQEHYDQVKQFRQQCYEDCRNVARNWSMPDDNTCVCVDYVTQPRGQTFCEHCAEVCKNTAVLECHDGNDTWGAGGNTCKCK